jgi:hypothetical protein
MSSSEPFDEEKPKPELQLEAIDGGPGGPGKTAIGAGSPDDEPNSQPFAPTETPKWFAWVFPVARAFISCQLARLSPKNRRERCENAMLTDDELTVLNLRWDLNLNLDWKISGDGIKHLSPTESYLEHRSVWKLWSYTLWQRQNASWLETAPAWCAGLAVIWLLLPAVKNYYPSEGCYFGSWYHLWGEPASLLVLTVVWTAICFWSPASLVAVQILSNKGRQKT